MTRGSTPPSPAAERATATLWIVLAALAISRLALGFVPRMDLWALNVLRFVAPGVGLALWTAGAIVMLPPVARRLEPGLARLAGVPGTPWILAAGATLLALGLPDEIRYLGDFLLRQGTIEQAGRPSVLFPQALPLDVLLHYRMPRFLVETVGIEPNSATRMLGALEAAALGACAASLPRALGLGGRAAIAAAATVMFGGYLGMFTGYSKATADLAVIVAAMGVMAVLAVREGRGLLRLGLLAVAGLALHRSALALVPGLALTWLLWARAQGSGAAWRRPGVLVAALVPIVGCALLVPRLLATIAQVDVVVHLAPKEVQEAGGPLATAFSETRLVDLLNLVLMLSPLAGPAFVAALFRPRSESRGRELVLLAAFALPFVLVTPLLHPVQGFHRDWDNFAPAGVALSMLAACVIGDLLVVGPRPGAASAGASAGPHARGLAVAVVAGALVPTLLWLVHHADVDRGLERMRSFVVEPPERSRSDRALTWDFLGIRDLRLGRNGQAADELARAAALAPTPRILLEWGHAALESGRVDDAERAYRMLTASAPADPMSWTRLGRLLLRRGDVVGARVVVDSLRSRAPGHPGVGELEYLLNRSAK